jgi:hypothetical protein
MPTREPSSAVDLYVEKHYPSLAETKTRKTVDPAQRDRFAEDGNQGYRDGSKVRLAAGGDGSDAADAAQLGAAPKQLGHG